MRAFRFGTIRVRDGELNEAAVPALARAGPPAGPGCLTELPQLLQSREELEEFVLESLMPWSKVLPEECYSKRRR